MENLFDPTSRNLQSEAIQAWFRYPSIHVDTGKKKHLTVRARAGTGKTTNIVDGVNVAPERKILLAAFNKSIAKELGLRIKNANAQAKTLHAVGLSCITRYWGRLTVDNQARGRSLTDAASAPTGTFTIDPAWSPEVKARLTRLGTQPPPDAIKRLITKLHTHGREMLPHATEVGDLTNIAIAFECEPSTEWIAQGYTLEYVERAALRAMEIAARIKPALIDYADMIFLPVRNGWLFPEYDLVVVDEAQDMTVTQLEIARGVCKPDGRLAVVGDDRQAIYGFRGADSGSLDRLKAELNAVELPLTRTYRCGKVIVEAAALLVPDFEAHEDNHDGVIEHLLSEKLIETAEPGDFILSRTNAPLVRTMLALIRNGKRARLQGRDLISGLQTLLNKLSRDAVGVSGLLANIADWRSIEVDRQVAAGRSDEQIAIVIDKAETLVAIAEGAKTLADVTRNFSALFMDDGLAAIMCSTVHRAKGLEASRVFILNDTFYRWGRSAEEVNLEYVAITRAKHTLVRVIGETL